MATEPQFPRLTPLSEALLYLGPVLVDCTRLAGYKPRYMQLRDYVLAL